MADLLLTGAEGQLGWEVARRARRAGLSLQAAARAHLDISDGEAVRRVMAALSPRLVINAAAYTAVDRAESDQETAMAVNCRGPAHLAEAARDVGAALIHVSTDYVFDGGKPAPYNESDPTAPLGVYGTSKLAGENAIRERLDRHVILRTSWVYGIHGHNFVKTMLRLGRERPLLRVVADQHGAPTFAGDLAEAVLSIARAHLADRMPESSWGLFHCTNAGQTSWHGFATRIFQLAGRPGETAPNLQPILTADYPLPAVRPANSLLDCTRLAWVHGIRLRPWEDALAEAIPAILRGEEKAE
jgi:dTDP-4-dehydrorhamnose reductase